MAASIRSHVFMKISHISQHFGQYAAIQNQTLHRKCFHTSSFCLSKDSKWRMSRKQDRAMEKMKRKVGGESHGKRRVWYENPGNLVGATGSFGVKRGPSMGQQKRAKQLGVVLYEYITSMINSGEVDDRLPQMGIDVVKVKISTDFSIINIYWLASGEEKDRELEKILPDIAFKLRHALVSLQVMGRLPPIQFVKDHSVSRLQEIEHLLGKADMGPDHIPTALGHDMKVSPTLKQAPQNISIQQKLDQAATTFQYKDVASNQHITSHVPQEHTSKESEDILPDTAQVEHGKVSAVNANIHLEDLLRNDLYKVNHKTIMDKLTQAKARGSRSESILKFGSSSSEMKFTPLQEALQKRLSKQWITRHGRDRFQALSLAGQSRGQAAASFDQNEIKDDGEEFDEETDYFSDEDSNKDINVK